MRKDQPRSFRLSPAAIAALERLAVRTGDSRSQVIERLVLREDAEMWAEDLKGDLRELRAEVGGIAARLARLEGKEPTE